MTIATSRQLLVEVCKELNKKYAGIRLNVNIRKTKYMFFSTSERKRNLYTFCTNDNSFTAKNKLRHLSQIHDRTMKGPQRYITAVSYTHLDVYKRQMYYETNTLYSSK